MTIFMLIIFQKMAWAQSYSPIYQPDTVRQYYAYCRDINTHQPVPFCTLTISTAPFANSNAHFHNTNRPSSYIATTLGGVSNPPYSTSVVTQTDATGSVLIWHKHTFVGQAERVSACAQYCDTADYAVGYRGIYYVEEKPEFFHTGGYTTNHGGNEYNHWMTSNAAYGIYYTVLDYLAFNPSQGRVSLNDMGLPFGGKFDISQNWTSPHITHDKGTAVDIGGNGSGYSVPAADQSTFLAYCRSRGAIEAIQESAGTPNQHLHCRWAQ